jgi:hypothetical protein
MDVSSSTICFLGGVITLAFGIWIVRNREVTFTQKGFSNNKIIIKGSNAVSFGKLLIILSIAIFAIGILLSFKLL